MNKTMTDKRFGIAYTSLAVLIGLITALCNWNEDTIILGSAYALSLLSTWLYHRIKPKAAFGNILVMILYNAVLGYNLIFNGHYGAGFTYWLYIIMLNGVHSITLLAYTLFAMKKSLIK